MASPRPNTAPDMGSVSDSSKVPGIATVVTGHATNGNASVDTKSPKNRFDELGPASRATISPPVVPSELDILGTQSGDTPNSPGKSDSADKKRTRGKPLTPATSDRIVAKKKPLHSRASVSSVLTGHPWPFTGRDQVKRRCPNDSSQSLLSSLCLPPKCLTVRLPTTIDDPIPRESRSALLHWNGCVYFGYGRTIYEYPLYQSRGPTGEPLGIRVVAELPPVSNGRVKYIFIQKFCASRDCQSLYVILQCMTPDDDQFSTLYSVSLEGIVTTLSLPPLPSLNVEGIGLTGDGSLVVCCDQIWIAGQPPTLWVCDSEGTGQWRQVQLLLLTPGQRSEDRWDIERNGSRSPTEDDWSSFRQRGLVDISESPGSGKSCLITPRSNCLIELQDTFADGSLLLSIENSSLSSVTDVPCLIRGHLDSLGSQLAYICTSLYKADDLKRLEAISGKPRSWQAFRVAPSMVDPIFATYKEGTITESITDSSGSQLTQVDVDEHPRHQLVRLPLRTSLFEKKIKIDPTGREETPITSVSGFWCVGSGIVVSGTRGAMGDELRQPITLKVKRLPSLPIREPHESFPRIMLQDTIGTDVILESVEVAANSNPDDQTIDSIVTDSLPAHFAVLRWRSNRLYEIMLQKRVTDDSSPATSSTKGLSGALSRYDHTIRIPLRCSKQALTAFREYFYTQTLPQIAPRSGNANATVTSSNVIDELEIHTVLAELLNLAIEFDMPALGIRAEEMLLSELQPSRAHDVYEALQIGADLWEDQRGSSAPDSALNTTCFDRARLAATNIIVQYLGQIQEISDSRLMQTFCDIHRGAPLREILYSRYQNNPNVRCRWRYIVADPTRADDVVRALCEKLRQMRMEQSHKELNSLFVS